MLLREDVVNALTFALNQGTREDPAGSNHNWITEWYADISKQEWARRNNPWCAMTVSWAMHQAGFDWFTYAYCPYIERDARNGRNGMSFGNSPQVGDPVLYDLDGSRMATHVGTVVFINADGSFVTIEGNWRDAVVRLIRDLKYVRGFVHMPYRVGDDDLASSDDILGKLEEVNWRAEAANQQSKVAAGKSTHVEAMLGSLIRELKKKGVIDDPDAPKPDTPVG